MGYTHYWDSKEVPQEKFEKFKAKVKLIEKYISNKGISIKDGLGIGNGVDYDEDAIFFNGDEELQQDHESFAIRNKTEFAFCKTARKPYDLMCMIVLLAGYADNLLTFSSDGDYSEDEWQPGVQEYNILAKKYNWNTVEYDEEEGYKINKTEKVKRNIYR